MPNGANMGSGTAYAAGVRGRATYGSGVKGEAKNAGVEGISSDSAGVAGEARVYSGVHGSSLAPYGTGGGPGAIRFGEGVGVRGLGGNAGVEGYTGAGVGVWARAISGIGVVALGRRGLYAEGRPAAQLVGNLVVYGNIIATGWKSAALSDGDGSHQLLYAIESPEARRFARMALPKASMPRAKDLPPAPVLHVAKSHSRTRRRAHGAKK